MTTDLRTALAEAVRKMNAIVPQDRMWGEVWLADHGPDLLKALDRAERLREALEPCFAERSDCIHGTWEAVSGDHYGEHLRAALATNPPDDFPPEEPTTIEGALGALVLAVGMLRLRPHICGVIWPGGPNGESLACAYPPNPPGKPMHEHSWSWVPTALATDPEPSDHGSEYGRLLAERDRLVAAGADPGELLVPNEPSGEPE